MKIEMIQFDFAVFLLTVLLLPSPTEAGCNQHGCCFCNQEQGRTFSRDSRQIIFPTDGDDYYQKDDNFKEGDNYYKNKNENGDKNGEIVYNYCNGGCM